MLDLLNFWFAQILMYQWNQREMPVPVKVAQNTTFLDVICRAPSSSSSFAKSSDTVRKLGIGFTQRKFMTELDKSIHLTSYSDENDNCKSKQ